MIMKFDGLWNFYLFFSHDNAFPQNVAMESQKEGFLIFFVGLAIVDLCFPLSW